MPHPRIPAFIRGLLCYAMCPRGALEQAQGKATEYVGCQGFSYSTNRNLIQRDESQSGSFEAKKKTLTFSVHLQISGQQTENGAASRWGANPSISSVSTPLSHQCPALIK